MRQPRQREADLRAQLAANRVAAERVGQLAGRHGLDLLLTGMRAVLDYAERRTRAAVEAMPDGDYAAADVLEDDVRGPAATLEIAVSVRIRGDSIEVDFAGTAPQSAGNLNCPLAVTKSAVFYVLRVLSDPDIPPSAGAHRPVTVHAPAGCLVNARPPAAVAGGNVETSSRIADVVMSAFGEALEAPGGGPGNDEQPHSRHRAFTYYETLGGGQGACPDADGPSGVHVAMSNTLNTPIEALEREFPLRVTRYGLRRGSGGAGHRRGGDGLVREIEALSEMRFSLLSDRRRVPPPGRAGGSPGRPGRNALTRAGDPGAEKLPGKATGRLGPGDRLRIETPGGGGLGPPP